MRHWEMRSLADSLALAPGLAHAGPAELTVIVPTYNERRNVAAMVRLLRAALVGLAWEVVFVDDNSPDGTARLAKRIAARDPRVRCIRRVGRRGLAGAVIEGALASAAPYVAVIDGDLQHDETLLPAMLARLKAGDVDLVVASRYVGEGDAGAGFGRTRLAGSQLATLIGRWVLKSDVTDPVSGFFMARRQVMERVAPDLSTDGFKVLFDIIATHPKPLRTAELPYSFRGREEGASKLDGKVVMDYLGLVLAKASRDLISPRALMFALVGLTGVGVQLAVLYALKPFEFTKAQFLAAFVAMSSNYLLNNLLTYRDRRKRGWGLLAGYLRFVALCSVGLAANVAVGALIFRYVPIRWLAGAGGAMFGAVWNYVTTSLMVW